MDRLGRVLDTCFHNHLLNLTMMRMMMMSCYHKISSSGCVLPPTKNRFDENHEYNADKEAIESYLSMHVLVEIFFMHTKLSKCMNDY